MLDFKKSKTFAIIIERWTGKDMEQYFKDRNKEFIARLKKETKKKIVMTRKDKITTLAAMAIISAIVIAFVWAITWTTYIIFHS